MAATTAGGPKTVTYNQMYHHQQQQPFAPYRDIQGQHANLGSAAAASATTQPSTYPITQDAIKSTAVAKQNIRPSNARSTLHNCFDQSATYFSAFRDKPQESSLFMVPPNPYSFRWYFRITL